MSTKKKKAMRKSWKKTQALKEGTVKGAWKNASERPIDKVRAKE